MLLILLVSNALAYYAKKEPHSCEHINGLNLCPIRIGLGKSSITAIGAQVQDGQLVGWNAQGWCGLAHDVLEIDFGQEYNIKMVKVKKVLSSPAPEYIKLDYFDSERGQGEYQRLLLQNGMDNLPTDEVGTILPDQSDKGIVTQKVKIVMVLPETMKSSQRACMKMEIYYHESTNQKTTSSVSFFNAPGIELNFGQFKLVDTDNLEYWQFPFRLRSPDRVSSAEITWKVSLMTSQQLADINRDVKVNLYMRTNAEETPRISKEYFTNNVYVEKLRFNKEVTTSQFDVMFQLPNKGKFKRNDELFYRVFVQKIVLQTSEEEITYRFDGHMKSSPDTKIWLKFARINPTSYDTKKREAILIEPRDPSRQYRTLALRGKIRWSQLTNQISPPRTFTSTYATGYDISASIFTKTLQWRQLKTSREDTFWVATLNEPVKDKLVFYFDERHDQVEISNIIAYEAEWDGTNPDLNTPETRTDGTGHSTGTEATTEQCDNFFCNNTTVAGIIVGIICALMVIAFIAIFLVWKRRPNHNHTQYTMGSNRGNPGATGPIYGRPSQTALLENDRLNGIYSLPDNIPKPAQRGRTMPNFPDNFHPLNGPPSSRNNQHRNRAKQPNQPRQPKTMAANQRPPVAPPPAPEPIYEPPINFRENSPRLYGPCGTIRYAQPDALKSKADPPRIQAELVRVLEPLGSGEFGEVLLVEAPISAFPNDSLDLDLPKGAKDCLAALKRLKPDSSAETKETFLAEAKLMYGLRHPNILPLLAVIPEVPALLTGYSEHGDLRQFLRRRLTCEHTSLDDPGFISNSSLLEITVQIASAMQYLESVRVVHRDLAARNCFVGRGLTVRVGDFGMSRNLYCSDYFKVTGNAVLPIRWSAWESIILGKFTTKSDVWSFAVTCCETFSLCRERPLETMTDEQVIHRMVSLYKEQSSLTKIPWLPKPDICPEGVWEIIMNCWIRDADSRPTFKRLHQLLLEEKRQIENQTVSNSVQI